MRIIVEMVGLLMIWFHQSNAGNVVIQVLQTVKHVPLILLLIHSIKLVQLVFLLKFLMMLIVNVMITAQLVSMQHQY